MTDFALLNFADGEAAVPAIKVGDQVLPVRATLDAGGQASAFPAGSTKEILVHWSKAEPVLSAIADKFAAGSSNGLRAAARPIASVRLLAPILYPDAIFCAFANYTDHMREMSGREPPAIPPCRPPIKTTMQPACRPFSAGLPSSPRSRSRQSRRAQRRWLPRRPS